MLVDIMRPIPWVGGAIFHPVAMSDDVFRMRNTAARGQRVPAHVHDHMVETFVLREGSATFWLGTERSESHAVVGDTVVAPIGVIHAFASGPDAPTTFDVEFSPACDMARTMAIIAGLQDEGEGMWLLKYAYVEQRERLRVFSRAVGAIGVISTVLLPVIKLCGRLAGWERLVGRYSPAPAQHVDD